MTQSKPKPPSITDLMGTMPTGLAPMLGPTMRHFWEAQEGILAESEAFSRNWFNRRHAATKAAIAAAKDIAQNGGSDPSAAMKAISDWQTHSVQRVFEDFREWSTLCSRCAAQVATHEVETLDETVEKATEAAKAGARSSH
jgi:hypothetical protein